MVSALHIALTCLTAVLVVTQVDAKFGKRKLRTEKERVEEMLWKSFLDKRFYPVGLSKKEKNEIYDIITEVGLRNIPEIEKRLLRYAKDKLDVEKRRGFREVLKALKRDVLEREGTSAGKDKKDEL